MFWKKKIASVDMSRCDVCGRCVKACRRGALATLIVDDAVAVRLKSADACAGCGRCVHICPLKAIELVIK